MFIGHLQYRQLTGILFGSGSQVQQSANTGQSNCVGVCAMHMYVCLCVCMQCTCMFVCACAMQMHDICVCVLCMQEKRGMNFTTNLSVSFQTSCPNQRTVLLTLFNLYKHIGYSCIYSDI